MPKVAPDVLDCPCKGERARRARALGHDPSARQSQLLLHQSGLGLHRYFDRAAAADVGKMRVEEAPRRALAELAQHFERLIIRGKRAGRFAHFFHQNAMQAQAAKLALPHAARQPPLVHKPIDEMHGAQLGEEGRIEVDLVEPGHASG